MASYTPNYNLKKPADADSYDIADANGNMDLIDAALHSQNQAITKISMAYDFGTKSLSDFQTALLTKAGEMAVGETISIQVGISPASGVFLNTIYIGTATKTTSAPRLTITLSAPMDNSRVGGAYLNGWTWDGISLKSDIAQLFKWVPAVGKIIESGSLSAGDYGIATPSVVIPNGYKATGLCNLGWNHPGTGGAAGMVGTVGISAGATGTQMLYLSYYTPRSIAFGNTDFTIYVECVKSDYSLS